MENESLRKWLIGFGVLGALLVGFMGQRWLLPEEQRLVFAAGQRGGLYHELAQHLAMELQAAHPRLRIEVIETDGSLDNAQRLQNRKPIWRFCKTTRRAGLKLAASLPFIRNYSTFFATAMRTFNPCMSWLDTPSQSAPKAVDPSSLLMNYSVTSAWRRRN